MLHILHKHLTNERAWLRTESLGGIDAKYKHGARMAKERIPQLEAAIQLVTRNQKPVTSKPAIKTKPAPAPSPPERAGGEVQLNLFNK